VTIRERSDSCGHAIRAAVAGTAAAALLAGCGTFGSGTLLARVRDAGQPAGTGAAATMPAGSRAEALALARRLLADVLVPPGAQRDRSRPLPRLLRQPGQVIGGSKMSVDIHEVFSLPQRMSAAYRFLRANVPTGMRLTGYGQGGDAMAVTMDNVTYSPRSLLTGIYAAELVTAVVPAARGGSLLRADVQVIWFPRRTAAEHLYPAAYRAVIISATLPDSRSRTVTRTVMITSPAIVARLARLLNRLPAAPVQMLSCPAIQDVYQVKFEASRAGPPDAVAVATGCLTDGITVGGKAQPALWDSGRLATELRRLLRQPPAPGVIRS
jgi:hypothetical protein